MLSKKCQKIRNTKYRTNHVVFSIFRHTSVIIICLVGEEYEFFVKLIAYEIINIAAGVDSYISYSCSGSDVRNSETLFVRVAGVGLRGDWLLFFLFLFFHSETIINWVPTTTAAAATAAACLHSFLL